MTSTTAPTTTPPTLQSLLYSSPMETQKRMEEQSYNRQVADNLTPKVGQEFKSIDEAYAFYNAYAKEVGFSVRIHSSKKKQGTNELTWKQFVCYKEGEGDDTYHKKKFKKLNGDGEINLIQPERNKGNERVGCKAKLSIVKRVSAKNWVVSTFVEGHNHVLATPKKVHLLRSHRKGLDSKKAPTKQFTEASVSTSQKSSIVEIQAAGIQNVGCIGKDLRNHEINLSEEMKENDVEMLNEFFCSEKEKNPLFYFAFNKDEEDRMTRCFWADPTARRAYSFFGDIVVFDVTYDTNKYGMIFATFVGVNHHGQTIIFGCGFLSDETTESFVWLFKQWLNAMPQVPPKIIIIDQDLAIERAIAQVLPHAFHRYNIWHIMNKFSEELGPDNHRNYYHYFKASIWNSDTAQEFEASWKYALQKSSLEGHVWLSTMYEMRYKWVPAYVKCIFSAGMSSEQLESLHSFFKRHVLKTNSLMDFIIRFNRALGHQQHQELVCDHVDINEKPNLKSLFPMEKQMVDVYTRKIFLTFQDEIFESNAYLIKIAREDENQCVYMVDRAEKGDSKVQELVYDKTSDFAMCSCRFFEFEGIPCRHIIAFFRVKQVLYLPSRYILQRWTRSAKVGKVWDEDGVELKDVSDKSLMGRHAKLSQLCSIVVDAASLSDEGTELLRNALKSAHIQIKELSRSRCVSKSNFFSQEKEF